MGGAHPRSGSGAHPAEPASGAGCSAAARRPHAQTEPAPWLASLIQIDASLEIFPRFGAPRRPLSLARPLNWNCRVSHVSSHPTRNGLTVITPLCAHRQRHSPLSGGCKFRPLCGLCLYVSLPAAAPLAAPYQIAFVSSSPQARFALPGRSESHTTQRRREDQTSSPTLSRDQKSTRRLSLTWGLGSARPCSLPCLGSGQRVACPSRQMALRMGLQRAAAVTAAERSLCKASTTRGTHPEG